MAIDQAVLAGLPEDQAASVRRLVEKGICLPPQPAVLEELNHLLMRGVSDIRVLARTITQDPGIVAALFKVVQSAAYRRHQPFDSVEQILQALGIGPTYNLVRALSLAAAVPARHNAKAFEAFWARARAVGEIAMLIAEERVSVCNIFPDQAYLAGLFHDCGVALLMQRFATYCKSMGLDGGRWPDLTEEDRRFNADHAVIGYLVGRHWKLPDFICDSIRFHHDLAGAENHAARTMVAILSLAEHIHLRDLHYPNPAWEGARALVASELGFSDDTLAEFSDEIIDRFHAMRH